jgi:1,5-anhydro-D-fructose reductase (1,5-anhydro-D-mannitol-forming)
MAPAIGKCASGTLAAVCSRDLERAKLFAQEFGCDSFFDSLENMLVSGSVDAVYVGSPNHVHKSQVLKIAGAGIHVLCDKPLANTVEDCRAIVDACNSAGVKLGVGFHLRHNPVHNMVREKVLSGALGELRLAEIQYMHVITESEAKGNLPEWRRDPQKYGGGEFIGTGVHAIDLLRYVSGKEIERISALGDGGWYDTGFEMMIQTAMTLQGGVPASLSAGGMKYPSNGFTLYGTDATLRCSGSLGYHGGGKIKIVSRDGSRTEAIDQCDPYVFELDAFFKSVQQNTEPNASGNDGLRACEAVTAVYESLKTNKQVIIKTDSK